MPMPLDSANPCLDAETFGRQQGRNAPDKRVPALTSLARCCYAD
jgi:hypothetical protein